MKQSKRGSVVRGLMCAALFVVTTVATLGVSRTPPAGAADIVQGVNGFATTARVLMVGAHPDDEDTYLIAWLARGRQVETAYLSLTRGDGGQNLIGNELGEALGAIRTQEMLAARRVDGGRQYFARAFDFGFSKDSAETLTHWPREETLGDVVRVVRAFRPHVIVAAWTGTAADGHGHHTVSGLLARDAYDAAGDTVRFPALVFGAPWLPDKFYRAKRGSPTGSTLRINVGEFDPVIGRSYADLAVESRGAHQSQGQGRLAPDGVQWDYIAREASRVNADADAARESSMFDGIDTSWTRFASVAATPAARAVVDSIPLLSRAARATLDVRAPGGVVPLLARAAALLDAARSENACRLGAVAAVCPQREGDFGTSVEAASKRASAAALAAAAVRVTAFADRELLALGDSANVTVTVANRGIVPIVVRGVDIPGAIGVRDTTPVRIEQDSVRTFTRRIRALPPSSTAWWVGDRQNSELFPEVRWPADGARGGMRDARRGAELPSVSGVSIAEDEHLTSWADVRFEIASSVFTYRTAPVEFRRLDTVEGDVRRPLVPVNTVSLLFDRSLELMRANETVDRIVHLRVQSHSTRSQFVKYQFKIPTGLRADGLPDTATLAPLETREVSIHVRGSLPAGKFAMTAGATDGGPNFYGDGVFTLEYQHIKPIVMSRSAGIWIKGIDVAIPTGVRVAYIAGVSDDAIAVLRQLDVVVTTVDPERLASADLTPFQVVVIGPRAYARTASLALANAKLEEFARAGGTVVVQYGQQEMARAGMLPFAIEHAQQPQRVTIEAAPVRVLDATARVLNAPNKITEADFAQWVQERALYMPSRADAAWKQVIEMNDPGEAPNRNALLVARVGKGTYVYTTLSLFRQLPAGVDGAIRLFMNILSAGRTG